MNNINFKTSLSSALLFLCTIIAMSCVKTLSDEDEFKLMNGGKELHIHLAKGISLKDMTSSVNMYEVENIVITGYISGHNLSFLRDLSGGNNTDFIAERKLNTLNIEECIFPVGNEVYHNKDGEGLLITSTNNGIPKYAFENCYVLKTVTLPDMPKPYNIGEGAFQGCLLLRYINWGNHVRKIEEYAFKDCNTLAFGETLKLPEDLTHIYQGAFMNTSPKEIDLPSTIKHIGAQAFSDILNNVTIRAAEPPAISETSFLFYKSSDRILYVPEESFDKYQIEPYLSIFNDIQPIKD